MEDSILSSSQPLLGLHDYEVVAIFDNLVAVLAGLTRWILLKNQFLYTDEYCDAIEYEGLVFAATTRGTVFAWDPRSFGTFVSHHNYNFSSTCMRVSKFPFSTN